MKVLFVGGTGIISTACTRLAVERGLDLYLLNRGRHPDLAWGAQVLKADLADEAAMRDVLAGHAFDAVVDFRAYTVPDVERDLRLFAGRTDHYVFISSASAYQKPPRDWPIREDTPLVNPYWQYARDKIACEERLTRALRDEAFPVTVVRPSHTYGDTQIPLAINPWQAPYTAIARIRAGKPVVVPGDGTSLWTLTHNSDFAVGLIGLLGRRQAVGGAFTITSSEVLTWDEIYAETAAAAGVEPRLVHIASDLIAAALPDEGPGLLGDKMHSVFFDTSKIRRLVPDFRPSVAYAEGIRRTIAWFDADPSRRTVDAAFDAACDALVGAYEKGPMEAGAAVGARSGR